MDKVKINASKKSIRIKVFSILFVSLFYSAVALISFYKTETENYISKTFKENIIITVDTEKLFSALLIITLIVSVKCIVFLFDDTQIISKTSKYVYLLGYVTLPFFGLIAKIQFNLLMMCC